VVDTASACRATLDGLCREVVIDQVLDLCAVDVVPYVCAGCRDGGRSGLLLQPRIGGLRTALKFAVGASGQPSVLFDACAPALGDQMIAERPRLDGNLAGLPPGSGTDVLGLSLCGGLLSPRLAGRCERCADGLLPRLHRGPDARQHIPRHHDEHDQQCQHLDGEGRVRNEEIAGLQHH